MKKRVRLIDGLRGFSLMGILLANMLIFQYGMFGKDQLENYRLLSTDEAAYIWIKIFVEGSFMPIFMFLFGFSMIKFAEKLERNGKKIKRHLVRRFILLMIFGLLHSIFVWEGDILFFYGLIGLLMIAFVRRKKKTLLIWTVTLFTLTTLLGVAGANEEWEPKNIDSYIQKEYDAYSNGDYWEVYEFRNSGEEPYGYPGYVYLIMLLLMPILTCPMFLFGMYTAKSGWFSNPVEEKKKYISFAWLFLPTGLVLKSLHYLLPEHIWSESIYTLGGPILSIGYIFLFAYFYTKGESVIHSLFENVGRLSMTNYICQSIICTLIFYEYGLGMFGKIGVLNGILLGILIYLIQVILSHYYLTLWKLGPFEKIMRIGTYMTWRVSKVGQMDRSVVPNSVAK